MKPVGIQKIGILGSGCRNPEVLSEGNFYPEKRQLFHRLTCGEKIPVWIADDREFQTIIDSRHGRRLDRFSKLAIVAASQCLNDISGALDRIGLSVGNHYGGWGYVEPQMSGLYGLGMDAINPYVATAWFPAAAQGEISIRFGIKGHSKTFAAERLSSGVALEYAQMLIDDGTLDYVLAGGVEAPNAQVVLETMYEQELVSAKVAAGEAACFFLLGNDLGRAIASIDGIGRACDYKETMERALEEASCKVYDVGCIILDAPRRHIPSQDQLFKIQLEIIRNLFGEGASVALPSCFGETVGASVAIDIALGVLSLNKGSLLSSRSDSEIKKLIVERGLHFLDKGSHIPGSRLMVNSSDQFNQKMSFLISSKTNQ